MLKEWAKLYLSGKPIGWIGVIAVCVFLLIPGGFISAMIQTPEAMFGAPLVLAILALSCCGGFIFGSIVYQWLKLPPKPGALIYFAFVGVGLAVISGITGLSADVVYFLVYLVDDTDRFTQISIPIAVVLCQSVCFAVAALWLAACRKYGSEG